MDFEFDDNKRPQPCDSFRTFTLWPERIDYDVVEADLWDALREARIYGRALVIETGGRDLAAVISVKSLRRVMQELYELDRLRLNIRESLYHSADVTTWAEVIKDWKRWPRRIKEFFVGKPPYEPIGFRTDETHVPAGEWVWRND